MKLILISSLRQLRAGFSAWWNHACRPIADVNQDAFGREKGRFLPSHIDVVPRILVRIPAISRRQIDRGRRG